MQKTGNVSCHIKNIWNLHKQTDGRRLQRNTWINADASIESQAVSEWLDEEGRVWKE